MPALGFGRDEGSPTPRWRETNSNSVPGLRNVRSRALFRSDREHYRRREAPGRRVLGSDCSAKTPQSQVRKELRPFGGRWIRTSNSAPNRQRLQGFACAARSGLVAPPQGRGGGAATSLGLTESPSSRPVCGRQADAQIALQTGLRADQGHDRQAALLRRCVPVSRAFLPS